jgi:hypothetical protein
MDFHGAGFLQLATLLSRAHTDEWRVTALSPGGRWGDMRSEGLPRFGQE